MFKKAANIVKYTLSTILAGVLVWFAFRGVDWKAFWEGLQQTRICAVWDAMTLGQVRLGDYTSRHTFRDGVLTCRIRSSVVRAHLLTQVEFLRQRLNAALQDEVVKQLKLT